MKQKGGASIGNHPLFYTQKNATYFGAARTGMCCLLVVNSWASIVLLFTNISYTHTIIAFYFRGRHHYSNKIPYISLSIYRMSKICISTRTPQTGQCRQLRISSILVCTTENTMHLMPLFTASDANQQPTLITCTTLVERASYNDPLTYACGGAPSVTLMRTTTSVLGTAPFPMCTADLSSTLLTCTRT